MAWNNRNVFSHSSGGKWSEIKLLAQLAPCGSLRKAGPMPLPAPADCGQCWHSLPCRHITPIAVSNFIWCSLYVSLCLFLWGHQWLDLGPTLILNNLSSFYFGKVHTVVPLYLWGTHSKTPSMWVPETMESGTVDQSGGNYSIITLTNLTIFECLIQWH